MRVRHVLLTRHYSVWEKTREGDTETVCMAAVSYTHLTLPTSSYV